jgi:hypothetical protein
MTYRQKQDTCALLTWSWSRTALAGGIRDTGGSTVGSEGRTTPIGAASGVGVGSSVVPDPFVDAASEAGEWENGGVAVACEASESMMREIVSHDARRRQCGVVGATPAQCCRCMC